MRGLIDDLSNKRADIYKIIPPEKKLLVFCLQPVFLYLLPFLSSCPFFLYLSKNRLKTVLYVLKRGSIVCSVADIEWKYPYVSVGPQPVLLYLLPISIFLPLLLLLSENRLKNILFVLKRDPVVCNIVADAEL